MKTYRAIVPALLVLCAVMASVVVSPVWAGKKNSSGMLPLNADEVAALTYMREEEKLARDVYLIMYEYWGAETFEQIAVSEQQHMDIMETKLDKYDLPDPALPGIGKFTDPYLQKKYAELVEIGAESLIQGLYVGATIEEIDMVDIQHAIGVTKHLDIVVAYQNLLEGSKNHLRAYVRAFSAQGGTYEPQYISQELFDAIMGL